MRNPIQNPKSKNLFVTASGPNKAMRVLYFLDSVGRGGAEMQALDVCRNAADHGIEITFATARGGALESQFRDSGAYFERLERRLPIDLYLASKLRRIIKARRIEIVHGYQPVDGLHLYLASRGLKNVKKVLSFQGFIQDRKNRLTAKFLGPRMDANIAASRGLKKWLAEKDGLDTSRNFTVIYNGADPKRLRPSGKSIKEELGLSATTLLAGMIGNFYRDPRKDQMTLCRALPKVFEKIDNAHCVLAGGIENGAEDKFADCVNFCIEHKIADRVHFLGTRGDVPDILAELDVFVFSSLHEGLPVAVSEAMLAGVPMIVSDIEPLLEATREGRYAEVFPVKDDRALSGKMIDLFENENGRRGLAENARRYAEENLSIAAHLKALTSLYTTLLDAAS